MGAAKRRRKQHAQGFSHLAKICGKAVKGGRPVYKRHALLDVHEAIARERQKAAAEMRRKAKGKKK